MVAILKKEIGSLLHPNTKTNPKWLRNLNIKRKLKNTERKHEFFFKNNNIIRVGKPFLNITLNPKP